MVTVDATARGCDGISLVTAILDGGPVPTRVTVRNRLDGPVWPPRRMGEPLAGWDETGYEAVVPADERVALGYACPAPPANPPLEIVDAERASTDHEENLASPSAVLRGLGSPAPPRDAVPLPAPGGEETENDQERPAGADRSGRESDRSDGTPVRRRDSAAHDVDATRKVAGREHDDRPPSDVPDDVVAWLDRAAERVERAESLAEAADVPAATEAVRAVGSLDAAATLERRRSTDAERLREIARRANALAYRAESAAVPVQTLERLA